MKANAQLEQRGGGSSPAICSAVFASENLMAITGPCGHAVPIEQAIEDVDRYNCPLCGIRYRIHQEPPTIYPSGFIMPGDRKIVIEPQGNLPTRQPNAKVSDAPGSAAPNRESTL